MKPLAGLSLDLDNEWSYLKVRGRPEWAELPSYIPRLVDLGLAAFDQVGVKITWFIVGQDAVQPENQAALARLVPAGHEVGNHSFRHEPWLHRYSRDELVDELSKAEEAIARACGQRPTGFRGPGYSVTATVLETLLDRGYRYDASTLPTWIGPLARAYYFRAAKLDAAEREERSQLFGTWKEALRPVKPYWWRLDDGRRLLELPVTTIPGLRTPFHLSYLLYLARRSTVAMEAYLQLALRACRVTGTPVSFLLHPLDLLGGDAVPSLAFFPGMDLSTATKQALFVRVLRRLAGLFDVVPMGDLAESLRVDPRLSERPWAGDT
ncbi:MAG: polysaccharide deacetylase family protein [Myxococcales bacterium]|nr:polysaccharide deacetylase family protein [Myxococcales bacterium]